MFRMSCACFRACCVVPHVEDWMLKTGEAGEEVFVVGSWHVKRIVM